TPLYKFTKAEGANLSAGFSDLLLLDSTGRYLEIFSRREFLASRPLRLGPHCPGVGESLSGPLSCVPRAPQIRAARLKAFTKRAPISASPHLTQCEMPSATCG